MRTSITIQGRHTYEASVSDNALGTISSLEHALGTVEERLRDREIDLRQCHRQIEDLGKQLGQAFDHEEKLTVATRRQQEIVTALDITKNQASAKIDEGSERAEGMVEAVQQSAQRNGRKHTPTV